MKGNTTIEHGSQIFGNKMPQKVQRKAEKMQAVQMLQLLEGDHGK